MAGFDANAWVRGAWRRTLDVTTLLPWIVVIAACTGLEPGSDTLPNHMIRREGADAAPPPSVDTAWACLDQPAPARAVARVASVRLTLVIADIGLEAPPEGVKVRACHLLDVACQTPVTGSVEPAPDGSLQLVLPQGFTGFVEITSSDSVPTLFFPSAALSSDAVEELWVLTRAGLEALAAAGGTRIDAGRGHLLVRAFDCEDAPASEVEVSSRGGGQPFRFENGLPSLGSSVTTANGLAGFVNVPPGLAVLSGRELGSGRAAGRASVIIRPEWLTYGDVKPLAD